MTTQTILDDATWARQAALRAQAEATLQRALADFLQPCCTGVERRRRIRFYLRAHAVAEALRVLEAAR